MVKEVPGRGGLSRSMLCSDIGYFNIFDGVSYNRDIAPPGGPGHGAEGRITARNMGLRSSTSATRSM